MTRRRPRRLSMKGVALVIVSALLSGLTGCSDLGSTGDLNYIQGDGTIIEIPPEDRGDAVEISGDSMQGEPIDLADWRGEVVVINVWGSWCTPCAKEAPLLADADEQLDAQFLGLLARAEPDQNTLAFERRFGIEYPTLDDDGESQLALGRYAPRSPPSTLVLDREGRVAALISAVIPSLTTLVEIVEDVAAEDG